MMKNVESQDTLPIRDYIYQPKSTSDPPPEPECNRLRCSSECSSFCGICCNGEEFQSCMCVESVESKVSYV